MASSWINIDRLGVKGIEPDLMPPHREPNSLDEAVNVRALGPNLANAGGYRLIPNASLPQETIPSSCVCPDAHYELSRADLVNWVDQSYFRDWGGAQPDRWITLFQVNADALDYDQILYIRRGECESVRQETIQIQILNQAGNRKVRLIETNNVGAETIVHLDYDADAIFGDGQIHWVFVERHSTTNSFDFRIVIDATSVYDAGFVWQHGADFLAFDRGSVPATLFLPVPIWKYSAAIWTCLTNGAYTGLGRCARTGVQSRIAFDPVKTDAAINLYANNAIAVPQAVAPVARNAWGKVKSVQSRVYFEVVRNLGACITPTYSAGAAGSAVGLGTAPPGTITGSIGVNQAGDCYVDGSVVQANAFAVPGFSRLCIALDPTAGEAWFGNARADGVQEWAGNKVPGTDAGYAMTMADPVPVVGFLDSTEAMWIVSSAGCRYPLPIGFSYLEAR